MDEDTFILVGWPAVQELMEEPWFEEECHLAMDDAFVEKLNKVSPAYFVPTERLNSFRRNQEELYWQHLHDHSDANED